MLDQERFVTLSMQQLSFAEERITGTEDPVWAIHVNHDALTQFIANENAGQASVGVPPAPFIDHAPTGAWTCDGLVQDIIAFVGKQGAGPRRGVIVQDDETQTARCANALSAIELNGYIQACLADAAGVSGGAVGGPIFQITSIARREWRTESALRFVAVKWPSLGAARPLFS